MQWITIWCLYNGADRAQLVSIAADEAAVFSTAFWMLHRVVSTALWYHYHRINAIVADLIKIGYLFLLLWTTVMTCDSF